MIRRLALLLLTLVEFGRSQIPDSQLVLKTAYGPIKLSHMRLLRNKDAQQPCGFGMNVENASGVSWPRIDFLINAGGRDTSDIPWTFQATVTIADLTIDAARYVADGCIGFFSYSTIDKFSITIANGTPDPRDVKAYKQATAAAQAERKRAADAAASRAAFLSKLPTLNAGGSVAFLGSDRKCAVQFQDALAMEGLEKRKRIAELVSYQCGILVDNSVRITPGQRDGTFLVVTIADGKHQGKSGWVPIAWLK